MAAKKNNKRIAIFLGCTCLLVFSFAIFLLEKNHLINFYNKPSANVETPNKYNYVDYSPPKQNENNDINDLKQSGAIDKQPSIKPFSITITRLYQDEVKNLVIRTLVEGQNTGKCKLEMYQNNGPVVLTKNADVTQQNNIFTCEGFDVQSSELPGIGEWTTKITVANEISSSSTSQTILLEK